MFGGGKTVLSKIEISNEIKKFYNNNYKEESQWRMIGAKSKFANLFSLTKNVLGNKIKVIEIGCGE